MNILNNYQLITNLFKITIYPEWKNNKTIVFHYKTEWKEEKKNLVRLSGIFDIVNPQQQKCHNFVFWG